MTKLAYFFVLDMLEILTDNPQGRIDVGKNDENRAFAEHYIEIDANAVKTLFDLRQENSTNQTDGKSPPPTNGW